MQEIIKDKIEAELEKERLRKKWELEEVRRRKEWENSIRYETEWGLIFKKRFKISIDGIEWEGRVIPLKSVTGVSWGSTKTGSKIEYKITIESSIFPSLQINLSHKYQIKFEEIIKHLWPAVAERLITRMLKQLKHGDELSIGNIKFTNDGVFLRKVIVEEYYSIYNIYNSNYIFTHDRKFFSWTEALQIRSYDGSFNIRTETTTISIEDIVEDESIEMRIRNMYNFRERGGGGSGVETYHQMARPREKKQKHIGTYYYADASYINDINTHFLEAIIRKFMEERKNNPSINKLSDLLVSFF